MFAMCVERGSSEILNLTGANAPTKAHGIGRWLINETSAKDEELELKPVIDYFFVLKSSNLTENEKAEYMRLLDRFGIDGFASGVMYILHDVFGLDEQQLLCKPNKRQGHALLRELFKPIQDKGCLTKGKSKENHLKRFIKRQANIMRFLPFYPQEILWSPYWMIKIFILLRRNK